MPDDDYRERGMKALLKEAEFHHTDISDENLEFMGQVASLVDRKDVVSLRNRGGIQSLGYNYFVFTETPLSVDEAREILESVGINPDSFKGHRKSTSVDPNRPTVLYSESSGRRRYLEFVSIERSRREEAAHNARVIPL